MFRGINIVHIDPKGRFAVPTKYRQVLMDDSKGIMVMTIDTDEACLLLYPLERWEEIEQKIQGLPSFDPAARRIQRLLIGHATEVEMDGQGRLLLPAVLKKHALIDKHLVLIGQGHKFELWSEENWTAQSNTWIAQGVMKGDGAHTLGSLSL